MQHRSNGSSKAVSSRRTAIRPPWNVCHMFPELHLQAMPWVPNMAKQAIRGYTACSTQFST